MSEPFRVWTHTSFDPIALVPFAGLAEVITGSAHVAGWFAEAAACDALILDGLTVIDSPTI